jgi:hypothetical protein
MKSPFPGMDPYLEKHWGDIHSRLIIYACDQMQGNLPGSLFARVEERVYLEKPEEEGQSIYPDLRVVEYPQGGWSAARAALEAGTTLAEPLIVHLPIEPVTETFIEIIDAETGNKVITVIEFLSLSNKTPGEGLNLFLRKQKECRQAKVSLVEVDLLRSGNRFLTIRPEQVPPQARLTYLTSVWRSWTPDTCELYPISLREKLPDVRIPLRPDDEDILLELQPLVDQAYRNGRYFRTLDYTQPPNPPLGEDNERWVRKLIEKWKNPG